MKQLWIVVWLFLLALTGCTAPQMPLAADQAEPEQPADAIIWASGKLVPARWAGLSPAAAGAVSAVYVNEGDQVEAGTVLIDLDNGVLKSQVETARAAVAEAEAALAKLLAGATPAQIAEAEAGMAAAQAALAVAQSEVAQARQGIAAAQAQVAIAQAQYNEIASRPTAAERQAAQREVDMAQAALKQAQAAYNMVSGDPHVGMLPQALALEQATAGLNAAQAAYELATQGATPQQLAASRAQIEAAQVQVEAARALVPAAEAHVKSAEAAVSGAQAALDSVLEGATAEDRAIAEARVASAKAALAVAQAQLAQAQVVAPFAGQVGSLLIRPGELATPGQALLMLGDTGRMHVETTDLRETDVTRLVVGMPVEVTFDALPGRTFAGKVVRISPMSTSEKGSTNYTVQVELADLDPSLRWGMTAFVNIQAR